MVDLVRALEGNSLETHELDLLPPQEVKETRSQQAQHQHNKHTSKLSSTLEGWVKRGMNGWMMV